MKTFTFISASSNSGKTTLIEKIVRILKERGFRVAVIKHGSKGFEFDRPGKDSWRFREAGADTVVLVGPNSVAMIKHTVPTAAAEEVEALVTDADIVIREGFKQHGLNRIEVFRNGVSGEQPLCSTDRSILALVSDKPFPVPIPTFDLNDSTSVAEFIIAKL